MNYDTQIAYEIGKQIAGKNQDASIFITDNSPSFQEVYRSICATLRYIGKEPNNLLEAVAYINRYKPVITQLKEPSTSLLQLGLPVNALLWIDTPNPEKITPHVEDYTEAVSVSTILGKAKARWNVNKVIIVYGNFNIPENVWNEPEVELL